MRSIDEVKIFAKAGSGGNGSGSLLREKHNAFGGPDGGHGGRGGNVVVRTNPNLNTLVDLIYTNRFFAENGHRGSNSKKNGKAGADLILEVPIGTVVMEETGQFVIHDLHSDQSVLLLHGGAGGAGNASMKTSIDRTPRTAKKGLEGEEGTFVFSTKMLADVGLVGMPSAGKSSLLSIVTNAKPKIAPYPFTTIKPQIGFVDVRNFDGFMMVDIPGIIEGANQGKGMGHKFLKHIDRCKILLHVVDCMSDDVLKDYLLVRDEIKRYKHDVFNKYHIVALNKIDALKSKQELDDLKERLLSIGDMSGIYCISAKDNINVTELMSDIFDLVCSYNKQLNCSTTDEHKCV